MHPLGLGRGNRNGEFREREGEKEREVGEVEILGREERGCSASAIASEVNNKSGLCTNEGVASLVPSVTGTAVSRL
jgi:hypothetical protein